MILVSLSHQTGPISRRKDKLDLTKLPSLSIERRRCISARISIGRIHEPDEPDEFDRIECTLLVHRELVCGKTLIQLLEDVQN